MLRDLKLNKGIKMKKSIIEKIILEHLMHDINQITDLCSCYEKYGSDKSTWHNYSSLYKKIFDSFKEKSINFLEVGLGTNYTDIPSNMGNNGKPGASLYAVSELYPLWNIIGLDIDKRVLFQDQDKKISTFFVDQMNPSTIKELMQTEHFLNKKFDIIIDDGLHTFLANKIFFDNAFELLSDDGIYIIEDILNSELKEFKAYFEEIKEQIKINFYLVELKHSKNIFDNNLLIVIRNKE